MELHTLGKRSRITGQRLGGRMNMDSSSFVYISLLFLSGNFFRLFT